MKILFIHDTTFYHGGAEIMVNSTKSMLEKKGIKVLSFEFSRSKKSSNSITYIYVEHSNKLIRGLSKVFFDITLFFELKKFINEIKPDIIHIHHCHMYTQTVLLALPRHIPVIKSVYDYSIVCASGWGVNQKTGKDCYCNYSFNSVKNGCLSMWRYLTFFFRYMSFVLLSQKRPNIILVHTKNMKNALIKVGIVKSKIFVIPFNDQEISLEKRVPGSMKILYVGRLTREKGVHILLKAMEKVIKSYPDIHLDIVGSGPERERFEKFSIQKKLNKNITFIGKISRSNINKFYNQFSFLIVPSIWKENFPLVMLEAMSHGLPAIISNIGGLPELVIDKKTGLLFKPGDKEDLSSKIILLLKQDYLQLEMSKETKKYFELRFNRINYINGLINVYNNILS